MMIKISKIILNANQHFTNAQLKLINEAFAEAVRSTRALLQALPNVDVVFYHNPSMVIKEVGIGGSTENENTILIPLDAAFRLSKNELVLTICHELHHAARMSKLGDTTSLLKKIISEGLADQFECEIDPTHHPITYRKDIAIKDLQAGIKDLKQVIKTGEYDYYEWFFGYGKYPNWFGYTLGNYVIEQYCEKYGSKPSTLVSAPAEDFVPFLGKL